MVSRDRLWVQDIAEHIQKAQAYAKQRDEVHLLAALKAIENIYEASTALSEQALDVVFTPAESAALRAARNFYVHQYHRVDALAVWRTTEVDLPPILARAKAWLSEHVA